MVLPLGLSILQNLAVILFVAICLAIILIVLLQKGRGGGISGAFGGGGAAGSLLGTKTGDFLTWVTICLAALFLVLAVLMGKFMRPEPPSDLGPVMTAPAETPAPAGDAAIPAANVTEAAATAEEVVEETADDVTEEVVPVVEDAAEEAVDVAEEAADEMN